jgi:L-alanine-DL-glutamate epimerase-like enolase superfamily enzyme
MSREPTAVSIKQVRVFLFRAKVDRPVVTSFGSLADRPALFVEVEDLDGALGWGEVWCNFPEYAAEERGRFLQRVIAPMFEGADLAEPAEAAARIDGALGIQAIQAGTEGMLSSVAAGLDQALWDLVARRAGRPLWQLLGGTNRVEVCASSIDPDQALQLVNEALAAGHCAFKLKAGFSDKIDLNTARTVREAIGQDARLMIDANQAWSLRQAVEIAERLAQFGVDWIEEPIRADEPLRVWRELSDRCPVPIASGENIRSENGFATLIDGRLVRHIQPDVGKWGGVSRCLTVGRRAVSAGIGYSPHWLGGGIGLAISLNLLGAVGGVGLAEIDINENPLRDAFALPQVHHGVVTLSDQPGFGFQPDFRALGRYQSAVS